jgi:acetyl esterase/lipase
MRTSEEMLGTAPPRANEQIAYGQDPNQFFELYLPKEKGLHPLVINIHGGYWRAKYNLEHAGHLCAGLAESAMAVANLEYRRVGNAGGGWSGSLDDVRAAYQYLSEHAGDLDLDWMRVVVIGHSAGGHLALCLAAYEPRVTKVISLAGVLDLDEACRLHLSDDAVVEFMGGTPEEIPEKYEQANPCKLAITNAEQWLVHAVADKDVPFALSADYAALKRSKGENVHLLEVPGAHYEVIDPLSEAFRDIVRTLNQLLEFNG